MTRQIFWSKRNVIIDETNISINWEVVGKVLEDVSTQHWFGRELENFQDKEKLKT